ncbi:anaerobic ribonucleoside-triphosphate reductase [Eubacterium sp. An3]|uniref:anaerobic ribonucleoside-triphosphate reductase n=1 Tax=Eubacterium sp. An3 TaxID=1965628 RepID=UPI000B36526A|nr:anaerobic ribonucleoside-triphosphate reductase [Eubacterium sp. An3]OUO27364.1 ribonucleoside-triphosphate reductase [Eubacterium sp. An3]
MKRKNNDVVGQDIQFERIRRITGYLVGSVDRFNNAKRAEEKDRVKHEIPSGL